jgi:hypothetical protein
MPGVIVITHGKHTNCWLYLDHPSLTLVHGMSFKRLPLKCSEAHYRADPTSRPYDVDINPGLLGAPFVQSIRAAGDSYAD